MDESLYQLAQEYSEYLSKPYTPDQEQLPGDVEWSLIELLHACGIGTERVWELFNDRNVRMYAGKIYDIGLSDGEEE